MPNAEGWSTETFNFDINFQKQIISVMIQEPKIFERIGLLINPNSFEIKEYNIIFDNLQKFYEEYQGIPTKEVLHDKITNTYNSETLDENLDDLYNAKRITSSNIKYTEENVKNFISCQAIKKAIIESLDDLGDVKKHLIIKSRIEEALTVGASLDDLGVDVYSADSILNRWSRRNENKEIIKLKTGWSTFDETFGGFGNGEIFSFMGPANCGKSMYLTNVGAKMLLQKKNVVHISLEMSEELCTQRYDMRLLGLTKEELKNENVATDNLKRVYDLLGTLIIKRYPASQCTATDIGTYLKRIENIKNIKPDILIVDYADIMRSSSKYNDRRFELELIYQELRNLGIEFNIPVVTATQLNREGRKEVEQGGMLTEVHIAESYGIHRHIDCGVTINATPADNANNTSVLYVCKNRDGIAGSSWRMKVDFSRASVDEWTAIAANNMIKKDILKKKRKG